MRISARIPVAAALTLMLASCLGCQKLKERDWIIVEKFCGEGWSMAEAVRAATSCHPSGVLMRVQEALEELVAARGGAKRQHPFLNGERGG